MEMWVERGGGILLRDGYEDRVVSIHPAGDGRVVVSEEYEGYYYVELSVEDAVRALREAIKWVEGLGSGGG